MEKLPFSSAYLIISIEHTSGPKDIQSAPPTSASQSYRLLQLCSTSLFFPLHPFAIAHFNTSLQVTKCSDLE